MLRDAMHFATPPTEAQRRGRRNFWIIVVLALCFLSYQFHGCYFPRSEVVGTYTARHFLNNRDTVHLRTDGSYHRKVLDHQGHLALDMEGTWRLRHDVLELDAWYDNLDDDLVKWPEKACDNDMDMQFLLSRRPFNITFQTWEMEGEHYVYYRVGD
jgi:hypothetical protein